VNKVYSSQKIINYTASLLTANYSLKLRRGEPFTRTSNTVCSPVLHTCCFQVTRTFIFTSGRMFTNWWRNVRSAIWTVICWHPSLNEQSTIRFLFDFSQKSRFRSRLQKSLQHYKGGLQGQDDARMSNTRIMQTKRTILHPMMKTHYNIWCVL